MSAYYLFFFLISDVASNIDRLMGTDVDALRKQSALYLLKMKEKRLLSQAAIDDIVENTSAIFDKTLKMAKAAFREKLADTGVDIDVDETLFGLIDPFDGLKTKHYQEKYYLENLGLIVSSVHSFFNKLIFHAYLYSTLGT